MTSTLERIKASAVDLKSTDPVKRKKAEEIKRRYQEGLFNAELTAEGAKPVPIKKPNFEFVDLKKATEGQEEGLMSTLPEKSKLETRVDQWGDVNTRRQSGETGFVEGAVQKAGIALGAGIMDPIESVVENIPGAQKAMDAVGTGIDMLSKTAPIKALGDLIGSNTTVQEMVQMYDTDPNFKQTIDSTANILSTVFGSKGSNKLVKPTMNAVETVADTTTNVLKTGAGKLDDLSASRKVARQGKVDDAVKRIVQGAPEDIEQAKRALSDIDTEGVKTYKELNDRITEHIDTLSEAQETGLSKYTQTYKSDQLARYKEVTGIDGKKTTALDAPVPDALDQLKAFYEKTGNLEGKTKVDQYIAKLESDGLTVQELNQIAKLHGRDLNGFNANGELSSGLSKQSAENTRSALKETLRQRTPDEASKELDARITDLIATRDLTKSMETKVEKLYARIKNRTLAQKAGGLVADVVDLVSLGTLRGFIQKLFPSNVGLKTANSIDLEKELSKNLKQIEKLEAITDDRKFTEALNKYLNEAQPGLSTRVTSGLSNEEKDVLLGRLNTMKSSDTVMKTGGLQGNALDLELEERLTALRETANKRSLTEREYAELKVLMDEVDGN